MSAGAPDCMMFGKGLEYLLLVISDFTQGKNTQRCEMLLIAFVLGDNKRDVLLTYWYAQGPDVTHLLPLQAKKRMRVVQEAICHMYV